MVIETRKPEETYELGRKMGGEAGPGQIVCTFFFVFVVTDFK